ncbi:hypothetical protein RFI_31702, partial [Reticulomyxa filosa]
KDTEIATKSDDVNGNKQWRSNSEGFDLAGQSTVEISLKNRRRRENAAEGFDVHILRLDEIELCHCDLFKVEILIDPKQKQSEEMELKFPSDRDRVRQRNLALRKEQVARLNLNVPHVIQKCFNRLHRKFLSFSLNMRTEVTRNNILKKKKKNATIDGGAKNDQQKLKYVTNMISFIDKVLESFWKDELGTNINTTDHSISNSQVNNNHSVLFNSNINDNKKTIIIFTTPNYRLLLSLKTTP